MVMPAETRMTRELKDEILAKIDERFNAFKTDILANLKEQLKNELAEVLTEEFRKREELESTVSVLQNNVQVFQKQITELKQANEELEQYGRRLCLRIEGVPSAENEKSDEVLDKVRSLIKEAECDIPDVVIDRAHRIGNGYLDKKTNRNCKSIMVRFTTFRHRTSFYRNRNKLKRNVKVKLDLTKTRYKIFTDALESVKQCEVVNFVMVDINCRLKVVFKSGRSKYFTDSSSLNDAIEEEEGK